MRKLDNVKKSYKNVIEH